MSFLQRVSRFFREASPPPVVLSAAQQARLQNWGALPQADLERGHEECRYVVVDVETSGLNMHTDLLIAIGAVAVDRGALHPQDAFSVVLRQDIASTDANILLHGIGGTAQREGHDPAEALLGFLEFAGKSPLVAYHAPFDQAMIERAMHNILGYNFKASWIDLAWVMPELAREGFDGEVVLDDWLGLYGIENFQRHNALADAWATAMLLQVAQARGRCCNSETPASLIERERMRRWRRRA